MKKLIILFVMLVVLLPVGVISKGILIELKIGYFNPSDSDFKNIYSGGMRFDLEATYFIKDWLGLWIGCGYFNRTGELTYTGEETKLRIIPLSVGLKYIHQLGKKTEIYGGLGLDYNVFSEENVLGTEKDNALGFEIRAGGLFKLAEKIVLDLFLSYSTCKMEPAAFEFNVGGFLAGLGVGYRF